MSYCRNTVFLWILYTPWQFSTQGKLTRIIFMRIPFHAKMIRNSYENHAKNQYMYIVRKNYIIFAWKSHDYHVKFIFIIQLIKFSCEYHAKLDKVTILLHLIYKSIKKTVCDCFIISYLIYYLIQIFIDFTVENNSYIHEQNIWKHCNVQNKNCTIVLF